MHRLPSLCRSVRLSSLATKYEKIAIHVPSFGYQDSYNMLMNQNISTPLDVASHIGNNSVKNAALAVIIADHKVKSYDPVYQNESELELEFIDIRQELTQNCKLQILNHKIHPDAPKEYFDEVNKAYWRTCSFFMSFLIKRSFAGTFF